MPFTHNSSHQRRAVSLFRVPTNIPAAFTSHGDTRRGRRLTLLCFTLLNGFFTVVSLTCTILIFVYYKDITVISQPQWTPLDSAAGSGHGSEEGHGLRAMAVHQIRSAGKKKGKRNPLLVSAGLFVVAGILVFSLLWMYINRWLGISEKLHRQKVILMRRLGWNRGGNQGAETQGNGGEGVEAEADANSQRVVHPRSQTPGPQRFGVHSTGDLTLTDSEPAADRDLEAQYHVEHAYACDGYEMRMSLESQQQHKDEQNPSEQKDEQNPSEQKDEQNSSESTVTMRQTHAIQHN